MPTIPLGLEVREVAEEVVDAEARVQRSARDTRLGAAEEELDVLDAVRRQDGEPVALLEPTGDEGGGQAVAALVQLRPGRAATADLDDRLAVAEVASVAPDDVADEHRVYLTP